MLAKLTQKTGRFLINAVLILFSFTCIFPIIWIGYSSLKTQAQFSMDSLGLPTAPTLANYISVITSTEMPTYVFNSFRTAVISVVLVIIFAFVLGYLFSRFKFFGRNFFYIYVMIGMLIPIHALLVPIYVQMRDIGVLSKWYTLAFPYVAFGMPLAMVLTESFIKTIPRSFEEAAYIDGASFLHTMFMIILPLAMPILATVTIISFFYCWNEFSFALVLTSDDAARTIPVGLTMFKSAYTTDYPRLMAGILVSLLPVMILYFVCSDRIIRGMMAGAIKG